LADATKRGTKLHLFKQHNVGGLHEYLGEVEVVSYDTEIQKDVLGKERTVFIFWLRTISSPVISEEDATQREIDSQLESQRKLVPAMDELKKEVERLSVLIAKRGPKRTVV